MPIELKAHTDAGARLVAIAEELSEGFAANATEHDRDGTFPVEAIDALKDAGYFAAPVPVELGGLGVSSAHDLVVASSRLARGDASVAIGVNMHLVAVLNMERRREVAVAAGERVRARLERHVLPVGADHRVAGIAVAGAARAPRRWPGMAKDLEKEVSWMRSSGQPPSSRAWGRSWPGGRKSR